MMPSFIEDWAGPVWSEAVCLGFAYGMLPRIGGDRISDCGLSRGSGRMRDRRNRNALGNFGDRAATITGRSRYRSPIPRAAGCTPGLLAVSAQAVAMAEAARSHPPSRRVRGPRGIRAAP